MFQKYKRINYIRIIIFIMIIVQGCKYTKYPKPKEQSIQIEVELDQVIDSIKSGLPYAIKRVEEWRDSMVLSFINAGFIGKEQIENRKGTISYFFYEEKVTEKLDAYAYINIDMNNNCIYDFTSSYGTPKELGGGPEEVLDVNVWNVDISDIFDIVEEKLGVNYLDQYDEPKVVLRCGENWWDFAVYENSTSPIEEFVIEINPITGEILGGYDNR